MTTAQDQQSREAYEDGKWYWVEHEGWHGEPPTIAPACYKANCDSWYSHIFSGISTPYLKVLEPCERQAARALPAGMEPVAGQGRFAGDLEWRPCAVEHVRMVLAAPQEWEGYEVRCLYVAAPLPPAAQKRYRLLVRNVDTIQADDEFLRDDTVTWQADPQGIFVGMPYMSNVLRPARRAIEPTP